MDFLLVISASLLLLSTIHPATSQQYCNGPKRGYIYDTAGVPGTTTNSDDYITVGLLFPFHGSSPDGATCSGDIPDPQTIQILEMARYSLWFYGISGVRVALEIFDSCNSGQVAVEQSVRYLNDRLTSAGQTQTCPDGSLKPGMLIHGTDSVGPSVAAFLTDAQVPIVSYAATQNQLTNHNEFNYFSRSIPSDRDEALAIVDTLIRLGWTYVSVIHSESDDDTSSMESFKRAAIRSNICVSKTTSVPADADSSDVAGPVLGLLSSTGPKVFVVFSSSQQASDMIEWVDSGGSGQYQWVLGQHALSSNITVFNDHPVSHTRGILGIIPDDLVKQPQDNFLTYFKNQKPNSVNLNENPWFKEFWMEAYQCNLDGVTKYPKQCGTEAEQSHANSKLYPHTALVANAVRNFLAGLNTAQQDKCGSGTSGICDAFRDMAPSELLSYIRGAAYKPNGDPSPVKFAVQNFKSSTGFTTPIYPVSHTRGILGIIPDDLVKQPQDNFLTYFKNQKPNSVNLNENPWFKEFWMEAYHCNLDGVTKYPKQCGTEAEQSHANSKLYPHTALVANAVRNFLAGLNTAQQDKCGSGTSGICDAFRDMAPSELLSYIRGAAYKPNGDPSPVKFAVQNFKSSTGFTTVGSWEDGTAGLTLNPSDLELWNGGVRGSLTSQCAENCFDEECIFSANDTRIYRNGDIILGGMFAIHDSEEDKCGAIREIGVQRLEAMLFALDKLNQDPNILPGITIGIEGFDTCLDADTAGHTALKFIAAADFGKSGSGERRDATGTSEHIFAILGPETDEESKTVSQITNVYELPVVGFSADGGALSNLYTYPNYLRVIPASQIQASAIIEMMYREGFQYMHVLFSDNDFGRFAANTVQSTAMGRDICTTNKLKVPNDNSDDEWDKVFAQIDRRGDARVLVLFLEVKDLRNLFSQLVKRGRIGVYFIISSYKWPFLNHDDLLNEFADVVRGITVVTTPVRMFDEFKTYFTNLKPDSNLRNPWFAEYWENKFQCSLDGQGTPCNANNAVNPDDIYDKHLADVIDAVYAVGRGLHTMQRTICPGQNRVCIDMVRASGSELWDSIVRLRFNSINQDNNMVTFNSLGDGEPVFDVYNYQSETNGGPFKFVKVGSFNNYAYAGGIDNNRVKVYDEQGREISSPQSVCVGQCHDCQRTDEGITAEIPDGDVWLGGFFRMHNVGPDKLTCEDDLVLHNMQLVEAFLFAIDAVNSDRSVLPNIKIGAIGFDTCGSPTRAQRDLGNFVTAVVEYRGGYFPNRLTVSGIIGEETSDTTLALADIVTPLKVSQISYAATTTKLDDREKYPYFMRTVASDMHQAEAMAAILDRFNWKYVSVVYSDNEFGNDMYVNIKNTTQEKSICIALALKIQDNFADKDFRSIVNELELHPQSKVVLMLTSDIDTKALLRQAEILNIQDLQWIGADTWGMRNEIIDVAPQASLGSIVLQFRTRIVPGFRDYFTERPIHTNLRNPWWKQYISDLFQCNLPTLDVKAKYPNACPYSFDLDSVFEQVPEVDFIVNAVNMFAIGLEFAMLEFCPGITTYVCKEVYENPEALNKHIRNAGFARVDGTNFQFDDLGNGPASYNILNVKRGQTNKAAYFKVGTWESKTINFDDNQAQITASPTQCQGRCSECRINDDKNLEYIYQPGQIQIPGLFAIHEAGDHRIECGNIRESGVMNLEAFLYAIDKINSDANILPNVRIGTTLFDTCMSASRGVRELSGLLSGTMADELPNSFSTVVGIVGAETGEVTKDTAVLTGQYKYAQVTYGSESEIASVEGHLIHAGPSYLTQNQGVLSLVKAYQWQYISIVQSDSKMYLQGAADFIRSSQAEDICVSTHQTIQDGGGNIESVITNLLDSSYNGVNVVVVFASLSDIQTLVRGFGDRMASGEQVPHLTWILALPENIQPSDLITRVSDSNVLRGGLGVMPEEGLPSDFERYLKDLNKDNNNLNPWFQDIASFSHIDIENYGQKAAYVIDATYAIAHAIHNMINRVCPNSRTVCSEFLATDPDDFFREIASISFRGINDNPVSFYGGSLLRRYKIVNFQKSGSLPFTMAEVGSWKNGDTDLVLANSISLFDGTNVVDNVASSCAGPDTICDICVQPPTNGIPPTRPAIIPPFVQPTQPPCKGDGNAIKDYIRDGQMPFELNSIWFIVLIIICAIGVIFTLIVIGILVWRWDEPITRTLSPFLCLVILIGIILLYGVTPIYVIPVSKAMCLIQRVYPGIALAVCMSGVFLQVMRHWRIGRRERRISGAKVSFVNNTSQVVLFMFLFVFQIILALEWIIIQPPELQTINQHGSADGLSVVKPTMTAMVECAYTRQDMVTYCMFIFALLILTLFVSVVARRYSHVISVMELNTLLICNFVNVIVISIWAALELAIETNYHRPLTCAATTIVATCTLIILFSYRVRALFRNHDPFVDTASVASGEYFSGTLGRRHPVVMRDYGNTHVYDSPPELVGAVGGVERNGKSASNFGSRSSIEKPPLEFYKNSTTGL